MANKPWINLGPVSRKWLSQAGIDSLAHLEALGAVNAYLAVKAQQPKASLNLLWALAGALDGKDWRSLSEEERHTLLIALDQTLRPQNHDHEIPPARQRLN